MLYQRLSIYFICILTLIYASCNNENIERETSNIDSLTVVQKDSIAESEKDTLIQFSYSFFHILSQADLDSFNNKYTELQRRIISDLNRIDAHKIRPVDSIVIPKPLLDSNFLYSPFPFHLANALSIRKILFISRKIQAIGAYEYGKLVYWAPTNTGKKNTPTPDGLFFTNWKAKTTISTIDESWIMNWYFNIDNFGGISIHEYALPGFPASHACIRLKTEDAYWFYHWAQQWRLNKPGNKIEVYGTPVIIYDKYDFASQAVWKFLVQNPDTSQQTDSLLQNVLKPHLEIILKRQLARDSLEIAI
jgi:hypothetical protein